MTILARERGILTLRTAIAIHLVSIHPERILIEMSIESATRFLDAITHDEILRHQFDYAQTPEDFLSLAQEMGFSFTTPELAQVVVASSTGVETRRSTGVWKWLRQMKWATREHFAELNPPAQAEHLPVQVD